MCSRCNYSELIEQSGLDPTPNRVRVLETIGNSGSPVSAGDIVATAQRTAGINRVTVYRILDLLVGRGLAARMVGGGRSLVYGMAPSENHPAHPHFPLPELRRDAVPAAGKPSGGLPGHRTVLLRRDPRRGNPAGRDLQKLPEKEATARPQKRLMKPSPAGSFVPAAQGSSDASDRLDSGGSLVLLLRHFGRPEEVCGTVGSIHFPEFRRREKLFRSLTIHQTEFS